MTETQRIVDAYRRAAAEHVGAALATVVRVEGSAYRRPGARMLLRADGGTIGVVSGGCLEGDIREQAARVMQSGRPACITYDATADDEIVWGPGSGCNGVVHVLIEPASARIDDFIRFLDGCSRSERGGACATVIRSAEVDLPLGTRMFCGPDGAAAFDTDATEGAMTRQIRADLQLAARGSASGVKHYGDIDVFIEVVEPRVPLVVFGAGADVAPLVSIAQQLGWHTTVVDTHARVRSLQRFAHADAVVLCRPDEVVPRVTLAESTVVVVMTHNYLHDLELLHVLLDTPVRYVGCLGPKRRTERLLSRLRRTAMARQTSALGSLHAPVGLDIGAEAPSEIALSIAAEVLAVLRGRAGGALHRRGGPIHDDSQPLHLCSTAPFAAPLRRRS